MAGSQGTWLDTKANKVVTSRPEEGVQLLAPGVEATPDELARVEAVKAALAGAETPAKTVTTKTAAVK